MLKRWCCVFGGIKKVWYITSRWNRVKRSQLFAINNNWWNWTKHWRKAARVRQTSRQTNFTPWQCSSTCCRTRKKIYTRHELGSLSSLAKFTGHSAIWLSFVSSHSEWFVITAFQVFWDIKNESTNESTWNPFFAWKMGKCRSFWRTIL